MNEIELYVMFLINKIEKIDNIQFRKEIYGMFLIHQENCEVLDIFDPNIDLDYVCPCQEIVNYIKLINFHIKFSSKSENSTHHPDNGIRSESTSQKGNIDSKKDENTSLIQLKGDAKKSSKSLTATKESIIVKENLNEIEKKEEKKDENDDEIGENSENMSMMVII